MPTTALKATAGESPEPDWLFGPEVERAYAWFLEQFRTAVAPIGRSLVDALRAGDIDPTGGSIAIEVEQVVRTYTSDLVIVFQDGTRRGTEAGRELAARRYPLDISFDLVPQRTLDEFEAWSTEAVDSTLETMTDEVTNLVRGAQEEGWSVQRTAEQVDELMGNRYIEDGSWKAQQISRTALIPSSNAGSHSAYQDAQSVLAEEWLATDDTRTRHSHREADGQTAAVGTPFILTLDGVEYEARFPGDPTLPLSLWINERCTVVPVFGEQLTESQLATIRTGGRVWT